MVSRWRDVKREAQERVIAAMKDERNKRLAAALQSCGEIVSYGSGDRYSHKYCDHLPKGHSCDHLSFPTFDVRAEMIVEAIQRAGFQVIDPPDLAYDNLCKETQE